MQDHFDEVEFEPALYRWMENGEDNDLPPVVRPKPAQFSAANQLYLEDEWRQYQKHCHLCWKFKIVELERQMETLRRLVFEREKSNPSLEEGTTTPPLTTN